MSEFADKVGVVAGGARGIGRAIAARLLELGARVAIADSGCEPDGTGHDPDVVLQAARELGRGGPEVLALPLDMGRPESAHELVATAGARFGRVDLGVYCAGFRHERPLLRETDAQLAAVLDVQLLGALRFVREFARSLVANKRAGSIVLTTWASAFLGSANQSALAVAAGGVSGFVKSAAAELWRQGIRLNAVVPTARTRLTADLPLFEAIRADSLTPEHAAQVACHLLSDAASDVHGELVGVAGGRVYAFRHVETSGAFHDGPPPSLEKIAAGWRDVTRR